MSDKKTTSFQHLRSLAERAKARLDALQGEISAISVPVYDLVKQTEAESGYLSTYYLTKDGVQAGAKINIPKDYLVKSAQLLTVSAADTPYSGAAVGDKYIDFVVNTREDDATASHVYLPANDLVDTYAAGDGIAVSAQNAVSVVIDAANANGLAVDASGVKLNPATTTSAGAMSAADKSKLEGISANAKNVAASQTNGNILVDNAEVTVYTLPTTVLTESNIATDAEVAQMLAEVFGLEDSGN